jgi:rubrerythrin
MNTLTKDLAEGLKRAFLAEVEGEHFYRMAAATTTDPKGREVFDMLAAEERQHQEYLRHQYDALTETGNLDETVKLGRGQALDDKSPIFSDALRARVGDAHFEMTALSVGVQLELSAEKYYRAEARKVDLPFMKRFYEDLADWEANHYAALSRQQESLREDYWQANGFSPF